MILSFSKNRFALTAEKVISEWNWLLPYIALCDLIRNFKNLVTKFITEKLD